MYLTEKEIFSQQEALKKSFDAIIEQRSELTAYFAPPRRRYIFFGCGTSYYLAESAQKMFALKLGVDAYLIAGGDYLLNPGLYQPMVEDSVIVFLSRSGSTSEMLKAAEELRKLGNGPFVTVTMRENSKLEAVSDFTLALPWAFDEGISQTRSATAFYTAILLLSSIYDDNQAQIEDVKNAVSQIEQLQRLWRPLLTDIARKPFRNIVVLADNVLSGIAGEAALVFTEICLVSGQHFNMLDYRHGPIALNNETTLTIVVIQPGEIKLQNDLLNDIKARCGFTVVIRPAQTDFEGELSLDCGFALFPSYGIALICAAQIIALEKALASGINPDEPEGLSAWVSL